MLSVSISYEEILCAAASQTTRRPLRIASRTRVGLRDVWDKERAIATSNYGIKDFAHFKRIYETAKRTQRRARKDNASAETNRETTKETTKETNRETNRETTKETAKTTKETMRTNREKPASGGKGRIMLGLIEANPAITIRELADRSGISCEGVRYHLRIFKKTHGLRHEGATKKGRWSFGHKNPQI